MNKFFSLVFLFTIQISGLFGQEPSAQVADLQAVAVAQLKIKSISQTGLVTYITGTTSQITNFNSAQHAVFVITRHAEKVSADDDTDLTEAGKLRAIHLSKILQNVTLAKVASTNTRRTKATAQPTATAKHLPIEIYSDALPYVQNLITINKGKKHLIVGHSNTVPPLLNTLIGIPNKFVENNEFNNLYVVVVNKVGQATIRHFKY